MGLLCVLMCGRLATPAASHCACTRAMLRSTRSMSITAAGVPYSRAIFRARGVVMGVPVKVRSGRLLGYDRDGAGSDKFTKLVEHVGLQRRTPRCKGLGPLHVARTDLDPDLVAGAD